MHIGKSYTLSEFLIWTRRNIFWHVLIGTVATVLYQVFNFRWLSVPWPVIALLGSTTAFIVGFKNLQTYNRTWEARQIWGGVMSASWSWAMVCRDYVGDSRKVHEMVNRHFAWLTVLRYQLRTERNWESINKSYNQEYKQFYTIPEKEVPLDKELEKYLNEEELKSICSKANRAIQILSLQSQALQNLYMTNFVDNNQFHAMTKILREMAEYQGKSERIKNFPYPRQFATINHIFIRLFCILLPFGLFAEFNQLNNAVSGFMKGNMVWLVILFSALLSWVYTSLGQVGEGTENPFQGGPNDVPISQLSRAVEIDIREMLGETALPPVLQPRNNIIL